MRVSCKINEVRRIPLCRRYLNPRMNENVVSITIRAHHQQRHGKLKSSMPLIATYPQLSPVLSCVLFTLLYKIDLISLVMERSFGPFCKELNTAVRLLNSIARTWSYTIIEWLHTHVRTNPLPFSVFRINLNKIG